MAGDMILVIDYGGTQAQSTARKLRGDRIYCEIEYAESAISLIAEERVKGLLLIGEGGQEIDRRIIDSGKPLMAMGACARELCKALGGHDIAIQVEKRTATITFSDSPLFDGLTESDRFFDRVDMLELPEGCSATAYAANGVTPAFSDDKRKIYGLQFYAETNDPDGLRILANFAGNVCDCERWWNMTAFAETAIERIRREVKGGSALIAISGGVDSAVCAALMYAAIGDRLKCVFVDTGLMRLGEVNVVNNLFEEKLGLKVNTINASERFIRRLSDITNSEEKREVIADEMLRTISDEADSFGHIDFLAQGTIYPDILSEKSSDNGCAKDRDTLKNHINFTNLIEPLRMLFKDEVRNLGAILDMPSELISRQPFPEAGLAVRCIGEVTREKLSMLGRADAIFREEIADAGLDRRIWQYFVVLTGVKTRGTRDNAPCSEYAVALRAVSSQDAISAYAYRLPYDLLERVVTRVTTEISGINRVLYDITGKPPAMIEWE